MSLPLYWVDAFTDRLFSGNPAAVVPLSSWPDDAVLQQIAFENGLSETAFFIPVRDDRFHLRWFTPAVEVDLCGHATLAAAHVLFRELGWRGPSITFESRSGPLTVQQLESGRLELDFPVRPASPAIATDALVAGLGCRPSEVYRTDRLWLCIFAHEDQVRAVRPDASALATVLPGRIIITAPGTDCDFVSRFFAPDAGIPEDPVTGSAHCTLTPYWSARLGKTTLHARQISHRGGELWCALDGPRVRIAGHSVLYLRGTLETPWLSRPLPAKSVT